MISYYCKGKEQTVAGKRKSSRSLEKTSITSTLSTSATHKTPKHSANLDDDIADMFLTPKRDYPNGNLNKIAAKRSSSSNVENKYWTENACPTPDSFDNGYREDKDVEEGDKGMIYRSPSSLLGLFCNLEHEDRITACDGFINESNEYYWERSGKVFEAIFDFFTTGHFHKPTDICSTRLEMEMEFWKIKKCFFAPCCMETKNEEDDEEYVCDTEYDDDEQNPYSGRNKGCYNSLKKHLYRLVEVPDSTRAAKIIAIISISMVVVSVATMIISTIPEFQKNGTVNGAVNTDAKPVFILEIIEHLCMAWFALEYLLRLFVAPNKFKFIVQPLNVIDIITIVPFYIEAGLSWGEIAGVTNSVITLFDLRGLGLILRAARVMRVTRVFKLARYSSGLKSFGLTVKTSLSELSMLGLFLITAIIFFSTLMFFAEHQEPNTQFRSIPDACWWAVITVTTVGYGDMEIKTTLGKIIASAASVLGILVLAFPITMIVENFSKNYQSETSDFKTVRMRRRMAKAYG
uniref:Ion_trans domain-containing protein n=1 Tax=Rhabditophanes sp. KR3021 TaxID=114890 RepID=A0AC35THG7_9BILA